MASIEIEQSPVVLEVGATQELSAVARDPRGAVLDPSEIRWDSSDPEIVTVTDGGLLTARSIGVAHVFARAGDAEASVRVRVQGERVEFDRPDDFDGPQIHVIYVIPSDGIDRGLDLNGVIARSVASAQNWLAQQTGGRALRFDTHEGELDVSFHRMSETDGSLSARGPLMFWRLEQELRAEGRLDPEKTHLVYYDGGNPFACGAGSGGARMGALYLRATPTGSPCAQHELVSDSTEFPGYWEFVALHEVMHGMAIVHPDAPNHTEDFPGHVPGPFELMYGGGEGAWQIGPEMILDREGEDYFGSNVPPGVPNLADHPLMGPRDPVPFTSKATWEAQVADGLGEGAPGPHPHVDRLRERWRTREPRRALRHASRLGGRAPGPADREAERARRRLEISQLHADRE